MISQDIIVYQTEREINQSILEQIRQHWNKPNIELMDPSATTPHEQT